ncbi:MAG: serine/threonine-protein phosphatase [Acidobacteria bacterium]|nr:serine/threonine-protein phosphatase [Acidobacteriota bacterium]
MLIDYAAITHPGKVRKNNEDAYMVSTLDGEEPPINAPPRTRSATESGMLAAVADGMGGAAAGEIASREGLAAVAVFLFGHWSLLPKEALNESTLIHVLKHAVEEASQAVLRYSDSERGARGMGSTLTAALLWGGHAYLAQIGDSRAYLYRNKMLAQLTTDQTLVHEMITSGTLTAEQARVHPQRNMITQALGCPQPIVVALGKVALRRGDRLLLCSDGLHGEVSDEQIREALEGGYSSRRTLEILLEKAMEHGARDNVTALLLALDDVALPLPGPQETVEVQDPTANLTMRSRDGLMGKLGRMLAGAK